MSESTMIETVARALHKLAWGKEAHWPPHKEFAYLNFVEKAKTAIDALKAAGWLSPDQLAARDAAVERRALERVANVVDQVLSKQDDTIPSNCICRNARDPEKRGEYCSERTRINCKGAARAAILALSPDPTNWQEVPEGFVVVQKPSTFHLKDRVRITHPEYETDYARTTFLIVGIQLDSRGVNYMLAELGSNDTFSNPSDGWREGDFDRAMIKAGEKKP